MFQERGKSSLHVFRKDQCVNARTFDLNATATGNACFRSGGAKCKSRFERRILPSDRIRKRQFSIRQKAQRLATISLFDGVLILAAICLSAVHPAHGQDAETAYDSDTKAAGATGETGLPAEMNLKAELRTPLAPSVAASGEEVGSQVSPAIQPVESELTVEGLASYGNYRIFASAEHFKLYTAGLEYDRHSWGSFLEARVDYVAEILPLVLLNAPEKSDVFGDPESKKRKVVPGVGISPIGFRMLWRSRKAIKPYLTAKGGILVFDQKVLSQVATYVNFSLQSAVGMEAKLTQRVDLRLGLFSDFHFSNGFIVPVNPGLDVMNASLGLTYHFGK
jgi:hypothetical protein